MKRDHQGHNPVTGRMEYDQKGHNVTIMARILLQVNSVECGQQSQSPATGRTEQNVTGTNRILPKAEPTMTGWVNKQVQAE